VTVCTFILARWSTATKLLNSITYISASFIQILRTTKTVSCFQMVLNSSQNFIRGICYLSLFKTISFLRRSGIKPSLNSQVFSPNKAFFSLIYYFKSISCILNPIFRRSSFENRVFRVLLQWNFLFFSRWSSTSFLYNFFRLLLARRPRIYHQLVYFKFKLS
jgi:hypothetical protein